MRPTYPWLDNTWKLFLTFSQSPQLPQAFIVEGADGIGKTDLIKAVEALFLCSSKQPFGACGDCHACHLVREGNHPDYKKSGDLDQAPSIDDIREITHFLSQTAHQSGKRVVTLFHTDKLLTSSANALLKTLEEPPEGVIFFLITTRAKTLLPTLLSRCAKISIPLPSREVSSAWLQEKYPDKNQADIERCLMLALGAPLKAQMFLDTNVLEKGSNLLEVLLSEKSWYQEDIQQFITAQPMDALYFLYSWLTEYIRSTAQQFTQYGGSITIQQSLVFLNRVEDAISAIKMPGVNKQLLFESLFHQWQEIKK